MRSVDANGGIGRAGAARNEAHAGFASQFGVALGHEGGTALLPANHESKIISVAVQAVEHAEVALAGHAECGVDTVCDEGIGDQVATGTGGGRECCHACKLIQ